MRRGRRGAARRWLLALAAAFAWVLAGRAAAFATTTAGVPATALDTQPITIAAAILIDPADAAVLLTGEPGGTIDFFDNGVYRGTYPITDVVPAQCGPLQCYVAEAHVTFSSLPVGTHPFTAVYSGHGRFTGSTSAPFDIAITPISHRGATTLVGVPATAVDTQPVTVAVALLIDPADAATLFPGRPGGTVQFYDNGVPFPSPLGVTDVVPVQCGATQCYAAEAHFRVSGFSVGTHTFTATYSGDPFFLPSTSGPFDITITPITTRAPTSTIGVPTTVIETQLVTVAAAIVIDPADAAGLLPSEPRGTVTFMLNGAPWSANGITDVVPAQCGPVQCYVAEAHLNVIGMTPGTYTFTAIYNGDPMFLPSTSAPFDVTITPITHRGATSLVGVPATALETRPVTVATALLIDPADAAALLPGRPGGTVQFFDNGVPYGGVGVVDVVPAQCGPTQCYAAEAHFMTSFLAPGTHRFTAAYSGDPFFLPSTSTPFDITITPIGPRAATMVIGQPATFVQGFMTTVAAAILIDPSDLAKVLQGEPGGKVQLFQNGVLWSEAPLIDIVPVQCGTTQCYVAEAHVNVIGMAPGAYTFTAVYGGDAFFLPGTSAPFTITIQ